MPDPVFLTPCSRVPVLWFDIVLHYDIFIALFQLTLDISLGFILKVGEIRGLNF